jgi:hypothetical protein
MKFDGVRSILWGPSAFCLFVLGAGRGLMDAIVNSSGGNELAWELQLQNLELSLRPSKGKVRTIKVTWGNHCSIFLDNPQGLSGSIIEVRINLKEQCQCTNYNTMCGVSLLQYSIIPHRTNDHKGHFFLASFGFHIWLTIALVSEANKKQGNLWTWDFIHDLHWDFVFVFFVEKVATFRQYKEAATTYQEDSQNFLLVLSHLSSKFGLIPLDICSWRMINTLGKTTPNFTS